MSGRVVDDHLPVTTVETPLRVGFFNVTKLSSYLTEGQWFYKVPTRDI